MTKKNSTEQEIAPPRLGAVLNSGMRLFAQHYSITLVFVLLLTLLGVMTTVLLNGALPEGTSGADYTSVTEIADALRENGTLNQYVQVTLVSGLISVILTLLAIVAYVDMYKSKETMTLGEVVSRFSTLFFPLVGALLIQSIGIAVGLALLILPGAIFAMISMYAVFIVVDKQPKKIRETFGLSRTYFNANKQLPLLFFAATAGLFVAILISLAPILLGLGQDNPVSIALQQFIASAMSIYFIASFTVVYFVVQPPEKK